uniref:Uncharacterized protein n=1 Tax=viral metagenome TaxID=1070528 RepID=A0A6H1ZT18_9ZZZZ
MAEKRTTWIDTDSINTGTMPKGSPGFLVEISPQGKATRYNLRDTPAKTNRSGEAKLTGWCGTTNNVSVDAAGVWKPVMLSLNGMRTQIQEVDRAELELFLEAVGWPELLPDNEEG